VAEDGVVHLLWVERALDERLREKFFPAARQRHALEYAQVREGRVIRRRTVLAAEEGRTQERPGRGRFQVAPDGRLFACFYVSGTDVGGAAVSENRLVEIHPDGVLGEPRRVPLQRPFTDFFTATVRGGSPMSRSLELLGIRSGSRRTLSYARIRLLQEENP
jgi:hypothetical protein